MLFSALTMNTQALHLDAAFSATQPFGQRLMNSMWTLATMVGASVTQLTQGTLVAQLGLSDIAFPHPLFARRHALHRDDDRIEAPVVVAPRPGSRDDAAHRPQPGRRRGRDGHARGPHVVRGCLDDARRRPRGRHDAISPSDPPCCSAPPTGPSGSRRRSSGRMPSSSISRTPSPPASKAAARGALIESDLDPDRVIVRINPPGTEEFASDLVDPLAHRLPHRDGREGRGREGAARPSTGGSRSSRCARRPGESRPRRSSRRARRSPR